jgi:HEPN domain-containing protein
MNNIRKPDGWTKPHPRNLVLQATSFLDAALKTVPYPFNSRSQLPDSWIAGVCNAAFAAELAFKALLYQSGSTPDGHNLWKLYRELPEQVRHGVCVNAIKPRWMLEQHLERDAETFVRWRYAPEFSVSQPLVADVDNLIELARAALAVFKMRDTEAAPPG